MSVTIPALEAGQWRSEKQQVVSSRSYYCLPLVPRRLRRWCHPKHRLSMACLPPTFRTTICPGYRWPSSITAVLLTQGYGLADVENSVPAIADTVYRIASISKPITATAAMRLGRRRKTGPRCPIQTYCPDFPKKPWPITARELLSHQSGIRDYRNEEEASILGTIRASRRH